MGRYKSYLMDVQNGGVVLSRPLLDDFQKKDAFFSSPWRCTYSALSAGQLVPPAQWQPLSPGPRHLVKQGVTGLWLQLVGGQERVMPGELGSSGIVVRKASSSSLKSSITPFPKFLISFGRALRRFAPDTWKVAILWLFLGKGTWHILPCVHVMGLFVSLGWEPLFPVLSKCTWSCTLLFFWILNLSSILLICPNSFLFLSLVSAWWSSSRHLQTCRCSYLDVGGKKNWICYMKLFFLE